METHVAAAVSQERLGNFQGAIESYRRALELQPESAELHCHTARALYQAGALQSAAEFYRHALVLDPSCYQIYSDLGLVLTDLGKFDAALEAFRRALISGGRSAKTIAGIGRMFERKGDLVSAADAYRDAIEIDPALEQTYCDLAFVLYGLGHIDEARECFLRLSPKCPNSADATTNLALIDLLRGDLPKGWAGYEARWAVTGVQRTFAQPKWKGEPLNGQRILLWAEQGLGDTLQFVRYVPLLAARGGEVMVEVQPALSKLLKLTEGASEVISRGDRLPDFQWHCPLLSVPFALQTELGSIPGNVPYVRAELSKSEAWSRRMRHNTFCVGLAWAGNPDHPRDKLRSIRLTDLIPLLNEPGTTYYSLQFGPGSEQLCELLPGLHVVDAGSDLKDFSTLAAIVANLDLVISVDTVVAHLAGAMGKPVWILLNKGCDWRWLLDRADSPWYPTARLFRQESAGQWADVVRAVGVELRKKR